MFKIDKIQDEDAKVSLVELKNSETHCYARINLNDGGNLEVLTLSNTNVIRDLSPLDYKDTFASSILFPFASRLKNGQYTFLDKSYTLKINEPELQNALHGLVYNKSFKLIEEKTNDTSAKIILEYVQKEGMEGFPFPFSLQLIYELSTTNIDLEVKVANLGEESFPCTVGWHPYFLSSDLYNSTLTLNSSKKIAFDNNLIAVDEVHYNNQDEITITDKRFDDCFILDSKEVEFRTPDYHLSIESSSKENYLQVYTINEANVIAIEPLTAAPNSFNTKKGLQVLRPKQEYRVTWKVTLLSKNKNNSIKMS